MIKILRIWIVCCLSTWAAGLCAQPLSYFEATVPVESQSEQERSRAAAVGLQEVLVRISGIENVSESEEVQALLKQASNYLQQFQYRRIEDDRGEPQLALTMSFPPAAIDKLRKRAGLPVWPLNRPRVLVWLVEDSLEEGKIIVKSPENEVVAGLLRGSNYRGLPLSFPLLDLDDQLAIGAEDVWRLDEEKIKIASERYSADTLLVGRYTSTSRGEWLSSWLFMHAGNARSFDLNAEQLDEIGFSAIKPVADRLANIYSVSQSPEEYAFLPVQVDAVGSFKDYRGVLNYFKGLALISEFKLISASPNTLRVDVLLSGDLKQLEDAINLDGKMLMLPSETTAYTGAWMGAISYSTDKPLRLQWLQD